ncbi:hypothetical protein Hanom_Chr11g01032131 [Helianthus anomalus]
MVNPHVLLLSMYINNGIWVQEVYKCFLVFVLRLLSHLVTFHSKQQLLPLFHYLATHCFSGLS